MLDFFLICLEVCRSGNKILISSETLLNGDGTMVYVRGRDGARIRSTKEISRNDESLAGSNYYFACIVAVINSPTLKEKLSM